MARDSAFVRLMKSNYALLGLDVQNVYQKTKMVLKLFLITYWQKESIVVI